MVCALAGIDPDAFREKLEAMHNRGKPRAGGHGALAFRFGGTDAEGDPSGAGITLLSCL